MDYIQLFAPKQFLKWEVDPYGFIHLELLILE